MEIWLIRHTTPKVNKGTCYGQLDVDLTDRYIDEAEAIRKQLPTGLFDAVYTSPLSRCTRLAKLLFASQEATTDHRLMELNFGQWEGQAWESIDADQLKEWGDNFLTQAPPDGENFNQLLTRVNSFMDELLLKQHTKVAVVTHSGVIRALLSRFLSIPASKVFSLELSYGAMVKITIHTPDYQQVKFIKG